MIELEKKNRNIKEKLIVIKLKYLYQDDPVDRLRGVNVVDALQKRGWNIHLFNNQKNIDLIIYLDDHNLYDRIIYKYVNAKYCIVDIQDNHINRSNAVSQYVKSANQASIRQKLTDELKSGISSFILRVMLKKLWNYFYKQSIEKADWVVCSSHSLQNEYSHLNSNITTIPDSIEIWNVSKDRCENKKISICWIGTENNIVYLKIVNEPLKELQKKYDIDIHIVCSENIFLDKRLKKTIDGFDFSYKFTKWDALTLGDIIGVDDIAIAPLPSGAKKSTNKILTYMSLGIPVVCSGADDYRSLYEKNQESFYFVENNDSQEWIEYLELLVNDKDLRQSVGQKGKSLAAEYSIDRVLVLYEILFEKIFDKDTDDV